MSGYFWFLIVSVAIFALLALASAALAIDSLRAVAKNGRSRGLSLRILVRMFWTALVTTTWLLVFDLTLLNHAGSSWTALDVTGIAVCVAGILVSAMGLPLAYVLLRKQRAQH
jgi:hypothetical protein